MGENVPGYLIGNVGLTFTSTISKRDGAFFVLGVDVYIFISMMQLFSHDCNLSAMGPTSFRLPKHHWHWVNHGSLLYARKSSKINFASGDLESLV